MSMSLDIVVQVAELVSAAGVIASLVYLAIQIKRSESTTRAATTQELLSKSIDMLLSQDVDSPLIKKSCNQALTPAERANSTNCTSRACHTLTMHFTSTALANSTQKSGTCTTPAPVATYNKLNTLRIGGQSSRATSPRHFATMWNKFGQRHPVQLKCVSISSNQVSRTNPSAPCLNSDQIANTVTPI